MLQNNIGHPSAGLSTPYQLLHSIYPLELLNLFAHSAATDSSLESHEADVIDTLGPRSHIIAGSIRWLAYRIALAGRKPRGRHWLSRTGLNSIKLALVTLSVHYRGRGIHLGQSISEMTCGLRIASKE